MESPWHKQQQETRQPIHRILPAFSLNGLKKENFNTHKKWSTKKLPFSSYNENSSPYYPRSSSVQEMTHSRHQQIEQWKYDSKHAITKNDIVKLQNQGLQLFKGFQRSSQSSLDWMQTSQTEESEKPRRHTIQPVPHKPMQYQLPPDQSYAQLLFCEPSKSQQELKKQPKPGVNETMAEILKHHLIENFDDGIIYLDEFVKPPKKKHPLAADQNQIYRPLIKGASDFEIFQLKKIIHLTDHTGSEVNVKRGTVIDDEDKILMPLEKETTVQRRIYLRKQFNKKQVADFDSYIKIQEAKIKIKFKREEIRQESEPQYKIFKRKDQQLKVMAESIRNAPPPQLPQVQQKPKPLIDSNGTFEITEYFPIVTKQKYLTELSDGKKVRKIVLQNVRISNEDADQLLKIAKQNGLEAISLRQMAISETITSCLKHTIMPLRSIEIIDCKFDPLPQFEVFEGKVINLYAPVPKLPEPVHIKKADSTKKVVKPASKQAPKTEAKQKQKKPLAEVEFEQPKVPSTLNQFIESFCTKVVVEGEQDNLPSTDRIQQLERLIELKITKPLHTLTLSNVNLLSLEVLMPFLCSPFLRNFDISYNLISKESLQKFFHKLPSTFLRNLNLSFVPISNENLQLLAKVSGHPRPRDEQIVITGSLPPVSLEYSLFLQHLNLQQCYSSSKSIATLIFTVPIVHFSDNVIFNGQSYRQCPYCYKYRQVTIKGYGDIVNIQCDQRDLKMDLPLIPPEIETGQGGNLVESAKSPWFGKNQRLRAVSKKSQRARSLSSIDSGMMRTQPNIDVYGEGFNLVKVWLEPGAMHMITILKQGKEENSFPIQIRPREILNSRQFNLVISETDLLAKVKDFQMDPKTSQSGYLFDIHNIVKKIEKMKSSNKQYKMFLSNSDSLLEQQQKAFEQDQQNSKAGEYISQLCSDYRGRQTTAQRQDATLLKEIITENYHKILSIYLSLQNSSRDYYPLASLQSVVDWLTNHNLKVVLADNQGKVQVTRGYFFESLIRSMIETYNPKLHHNSKSIEGEESSDLDMVNVLYSDMISSITVESGIIFDYQVDIILYKHKTVITQILQVLKVERGTQVPTENIMKVFTNRLPHIDHMKHCILSRRQATSLKSNLSMKDVYHTLNDFYTYLISISRDVVTEELPDFVKLDLTLKQLNSLI